MHYSWQKCVGLYFGCFFTNSSGHTGRHLHEHKQTNCLRQDSSQPCRRDSKSRTNLCCSCWAQSQCCCLWLLKIKLINSVVDLEEIGSNKTPMQEGIKSVTIFFIYLGACRAGPRYPVFSFRRRWKPVWEFLSPSSSSRTSPRATWKADTTWPTKCLASIPLSTVQGKWP
jgi:hypothetical protein